MTWVVALFQAVLSSICRLTQVVMIDTTARIDAITTSAQTRMRRLRLSGAAAFAVGGATPASVPPTLAWRHRPIRVNPSGFDGGSAEEAFPAMVSALAYLPFRIVYAPTKLVGRVAAWLAEGFRSAPLVERMLIFPSWPSSVACSSPAGASPSC